jgi:hypothetical protein
VVEDKAGASGENRLQKADRGKNKKGPGYRAVYCPANDPEHGEWNHAQSGGLQRNRDHHETLDAIAL